MPKGPNHTHKLKKHRYPSGNSIFFCTLPDCHFKIDAPLAVGKRSLCNICDDEFIMTEYTIKLIRPHCEKCGKVKVKDADGSARYVKKASNKILTHIAQETQDSLRSRLENVTSVADEDI
jgi:hypothetical protein